MERELKAMLFAVAAEFARATGRKRSGVWASAVNDARFQKRIESGKTFTVAVFDNAMRWFSDNWPASAHWPAGVARPEPASKASDEVAA
jgi:hypothetical protein